MYPGGAPIIRATACFSMYSDMSSRTSARSSSNRNSASARAVSVLPTPVGPRKMNEPVRRARAGLPDHALPQLVLEPQQPLLLGLEHLGHRNACPLRHDLGDVL